jgi:hypothetical protein
VSRGRARGRAAVALVAALVVLVVLASAALAAAASRAPAAVRGCGTFPRPGTTAPGTVPAILQAQYGVLRRRVGPADRIPVRRLGSLPESGILVASIRYLGGVAEGGRAYLVPARHLLASPLTPVRCVAPSQRQLQRALLPSLRAEYAHQGLCLVILYADHAAPTCQRAPGTVAPFLYGPGSPGLGVAPDGVARIALHFRGHATIHATVHDNFWAVDDASVLVAPCGVDWLNRGGVILRTVVSCNSNRDTT